MPGVYDIPHPAAQILARVAPVLLATMDVEILRIGGGTALAARWRHRTSTDIDITVPAASFTEQSERLTELLHNDIDIRRLEVMHGWMKGHCDEGEFSIVATNPLLPECNRTPDREKMWNIPLESSGEILARKLMLRIYANGEFVSRDLYDLVTAAEMEPQALADALDT